MSMPVDADVHPPYAWAEYKSTHLRAPKQPIVRVAPSPLEAAAPAFPKHFVKDAEADLTTWGQSLPLGERMVLVGRVLDEDGSPVRRSLVEVWQANASGRYSARGHGREPAGPPHGSSLVHSGPGR
jgi:protocatechuate 3,4-dioxygenase beta subunit